MKQSIISIIATSILLSFAACNKDNKISEDFDELKTEAINDFATVVAVPTYYELNMSALRLYTDIQFLNAATTDTNLMIAKQSWFKFHKVWKQTGAFIFGPVADNNYQFKMDTSPTYSSQIDSLLATSQPLSASDIEGLAFTLRGFHPIEYILFGNSGDKTAADLTARQKEYLLGLSEGLKNICGDLYYTWAVDSTSYKNEVITAGNGSETFAKKQELFLQIVDGMINICDEVANNKLMEPYNAYDSNIVESPYSDSSISDFQESFNSIKNVYLGEYGEIDGIGINDLVSLKSQSLDYKINNQIFIVINSFDNITHTFDEAIFDQRDQIQNSMNEINKLKEYLENELKPFITSNIQD